MKISHPSNPLPVMRKTYILPTATVEFFSLFTDNMSRRIKNTKTYFMGTPRRK